MYYLLDKSIIVFINLTYIFYFSLYKKSKKKYDEIYQYSKGKLILIKKFYSIILQWFKEYFKRFFSTPF